MDEEENRSAEELEALRQSLIEKDFTAKCQKWLHDLRMNIAVHAYRNAQFRVSKENGTVCDIEPDICELLHALQETDWSDILKEPDFLATIRFPEYSPFSTQIIRCDRCQQHFLQSQIEFYLNPLTEEYSRYCGGCIQVLNVAKHQEIMNRLTPCTRCNNLLPLHQLQNLDNIPGFHYDLCMSCAEKVRREYQRTCYLCNASYIARKVYDSIDLCLQCRTKERVREFQRVVEQNRRAQSMGLEATLTPRQWLNT